MHDTEHMTKNINNNTTKTTKSFSPCLHTFCCFEEVIDERGAIGSLLSPGGQ